MAAAEKEEEEKEEEEKAERPRQKRGRRRRRVRRRRRRRRTRRKRMRALIFSLFFSLFLGGRRQKQEKLFARARARAGSERCYSGLQEQRGRDKKKTVRLSRRRSRVVLFLRAPARSDSFCRSLSLSFSLTHTHTLFCLIYLYIFFCFVYLCPLFSIYLSIYLGWCLVHGSRRYIWFKFTSLGSSL